MPDIDSFEPLELQVPKDALPKVLAAVGSENEAMIPAHKVQDILDRFSHDVVGKSGDIHTALCNLVRGAR